MINYDTKCDRCYEMPADTYYMGQVVCYDCRAAVAQAVKEQDARERACACNTCANEGKWHNVQ